MKYKVPNKNYSLLELYETVARQMGHEDVSELTFDCRQINIANNIQNGFYDYYINLVKETEPHASEADIRVDVTLMLAIGGPKVDYELKPDEVEVFDKFIC